MNVYLMRHCEPVPGHPDNAERPLTEAGEQCATDMADWLRGHIGRVDIVITSPFIRAMQTATAMGKALGAHVADTRLLIPATDDMQGIWDEITRLAQASKDVLVVGHDPSLNKLILWLMGDPDGDVTDLRLDWGAIASVKTRASGEGAGALQWLVTPLIVLADKDVVDAAAAVAEALTEEILL
jgi:phosphohistidine phosphatase